MKKNIGSQAVGCQMISATDGSAFTGSVTVAVTGDAGTQATGSVGSGACTHEGNGYHTYAPAQAETNYDLVAFTFTGTGAIPATIQIYTRPATGLLAPATAGRTVVVDASGLVDANAVKLGPSGSGTAQTARDLGTSVLLSSGTGTGQLSLSSGAVLLQATQTGVTIPTVTNLTNAPGAGDFTATMKTSIGTAVAASAVASVTGAVGSIGAGGITASSIASDAITAAKIADGAIDAATFAAGAINAAAIASDAITDAKVASDVTIASVTGSVGSVATGGITAASIAADAIGASELAADAVAEIAAAISIPSAATIADAVWDEATSGHATAGTYGAIVDETHTQADQMQTAFEVNGDVYDLTTSAVRHVWDVATSGHTTSGTFGEQCKTDIDDILTDTGTTLDGRIPAALVSGRIDASVGAMASDVMTSTALAASASSEIATAVLTTAMTESYATDGATMTLAQACYMLLAVGAEFSISGTTLTCKKVDGSTTAMTFTLDDATNPTSRTRAS